MMGLAFQSRCPQEKWIECASRSSRYSRKNGLKITIDTNLKQVNFLDVTLSLSDSKFWPYRKENDNLLYIHKYSNHPPTITKQLPSMIEKRISSLSCSEQEFSKNKEAYNTAISKSGFQEEISYKPQSAAASRSKKRSRKRNILWFNPPFNSAVRTDIGRKFLNLIGKHFPKPHRFHKIFNRNTIKISYSCTQNMSSVIAAHNKRILNKEPVISEESSRTCNCRVPQECPLDGSCLQSSVIYKATVTAGAKAMCYIGSTEGPFKTRFNGHKSSFNLQHLASHTTLSNYIWDLKGKSTNYVLKWEIMKRCSPYKCGTRSCDLCLTEKLLILQADPATTMNKHSEIMQKCRHKNKFKLKNIN